MKTRVFVCIAFLLFRFAQTGFGQGEWKVYFGNLHSHTGASDGVDDAQVAYDWAKTQGHLDFLCLSEHNHIVDQAGLTGDNQSASTATTGNFVALVGQEFSTLPPSGGNHINLHNVLDVVPASMNNNYRGLFHQWLPSYAANHPGQIIVAQFNHPEALAKDYGISQIGGFQNYHGDWAEFVGDMDPWVRLIAIISGPADSNMAKSKKPPVDDHRDVESAMLSSWLSYLDKGMHLSPVADQDNHRHSWGTRTTARTGVWIKGAFSREALLKALQAGHCFATTDKNLSVWTTIENEPMGARIGDPGSKPLSLQVTISDDDEPSSRYQVEVLRGKVGSGQKPSAVIKNVPVLNHQTWKTNLNHKGGDYEVYVVHVTQVQDSVKDEVWTGPVWIDPALASENPDHESISALGAQAQFAGSKYSNIYHYSECAELKKISPQNLVLYNEPPAGKTLHKNCPKD